MSVNCFKFRFIRYRPASTSETCEGIAEKLE